MPRDGFARALPPAARERLRQRLREAGYPGVTTDLVEAFHQAWQQEFPIPPETSPPPAGFALTPKGRSAVQGRKGAPG